jgi:hypothetical protein
MFQDWPQALADNYDTQALLKMGMLVEVGKNLEVTPKGKEFCNANHSSM